MITDSFDDQTASFISLEDFYGPRQYILDKCLVIFSHEIIDHLRRTFSCEEIGKMTSANGENPIYAFEYQGQRLGFYQSLIGSTAASQDVIETNWLTGAEKFIMFGSAGSLDKDATANCYVIPTESYRDEGMSYHYAPAADFISVRNHGTVKRIMDSLGLPNVEGRIWTTDAFLRETVGQIARRRADGCIAVEMEVAGVQSVCDFHGLQLFNFLVTGDVLSEPVYDRGLLSRANHSIDKLYVALEIAKRV